MGKREDQGSQIRPLHEPPPEPETTRRSVIGVVALAVIAFGAIVISTGSDPTPTAETVPQPPQPVATTTPSVPPGASEFEFANSLIASGEELWEQHPEVTGRLVVAATAPDGEVGLLVMTPDEMGVGFNSSFTLWVSLEFDRSGQHMAYLGTSSSDADLVLWVGSEASEALVGPANSFAWHATIPGRIAWVNPVADELCWVDVDPTGLLTRAICVPGRGANMVGFDDEGFVLIDHVGRTIYRIDLSGEVVASVTGNDALVGPDGRILIVSREFEPQETLFTVTDQDLTNPERLDWAPQDATGAPVIGAWSPLLGNHRLAFLVWDDAFHLQVWSTEGELVDAVQLDGRVWDIEWDSTGRYILIPGEVDFAVADPTAYVVYVYDTFNLSLITLSFDGSVEKALLVTPSVCETASHIAAAFSTSLPTGVELGTAQMVKSRDANLESWYFMSATINTGPDAGAIATWALPGFAGGADPVNTPNLAIPINDAAAQLGFGLISLDPTNYLVSDWIQLDGAHASQDCVIKAEQ